jgi:hypothetical protein
LGIGNVEPPSVGWLVVVGDARGEAEVGCGVGAVTAAVGVDVTVAEDGFDELVQLAVRTMAVAAPATNAAALRTMAYLHDPRAGEPGSLSR